MTSVLVVLLVFFFSSRRRHTRFDCDWSSDVCSSDLEAVNRELVPTILERMRPYMEGRQQPRLKNWYILTWPGGGTIGARVVDESRIEIGRASCRERV